VGGIPGDATADQIRLMADLARDHSLDELRVSHAQNIVLPHVKKADLYRVWQALDAAGLATPNLDLITDIIACPGLDYCALANAARSLAQKITERFADIGRQRELGELKLKISGCINACGHHHAGHIGILGVDRKGVENYQLLLGGAESADTSLGTITGPGFSEDGVVDAIEKVTDVYLARREGRNASSIPIAASAWPRSRRRSMVETVLRYRTDEPVADPAVTVDAFARRAMPRPSASSRATMRSRSPLPRPPRADRGELPRLPTGAAIPRPAPARARLHRRTARRGRRADRPAQPHAPLRVRSFAPDKPISPKRPRPPSPPGPKSTSRPSMAAARSGPRARHQGRLSPWPARPPRPRARPSAPASLPKRSPRSTRALPMPARKRCWPRCWVKGLRAGGRRLQLRRGKRGAAAPRRASDPATPVLFLDTHKHFPETLAYRDALVAQLGLTNLIVLEPDAAVVAKKDEAGLRWSWDPMAAAKSARSSRWRAPWPGSMPRSPGARVSSPPPARACPVRDRQHRRGRSPQDQPAGELDQGSARRLFHRPRPAPPSAGRPGLPSIGCAPAPARSRRAKTRDRAAGKAGTRPNAAFTCPAATTATAANFRRATSRCSRPFDPPRPAGEACRRPSEQAAQPQAFTFLWFRPKFDRPGRVDPHRRLGQGRPVPPGSSYPRSPLRRRLIMWLVTGALFMEILDGTILTTALPSMARTFGTTAVALDIGISAYMLALGVLIPASSWLADRFGSRRIFVTAIAIFTLASALCGQAQSVPEFVALRVLQGVGGAMMTPVGRLVVMRHTRATS
jgi:hypothetical protein